MSDSRNGPEWISRCLHRCDGDYYCLRCLERGCSERGGAQSEARSERRARAGSHRRRNGND